MRFLSRMFVWRGRVRVAVVATVLALVFMGVLFPRAAARSGSPANRVVDLQRAYTPEMFGAVLLRWSMTRPDAVGIIKRENIEQLDSWFPLIYGLALAFTFASLRGGSHPGPIDRALFAVPLAAALLDYAENIQHLILLRGIDTVDLVKVALATQAFSPALVFGASACARVKYALLLITLVSLVIAAILRLAHARRAA